MGEMTQTIHSVGGGSVCSVDQQQQQQQQQLLSIPQTTLDGNKMDHHVLSPNMQPPLRSPTGLGSSRKRKSFYT